jgi:hypothetical protein
MEMENNLKYKDFFLNNNKSGWKTSENKLIKNEIDLYNKIIIHCEKNNLTDITFKEKIWFFINSVNTKPKCLECEKLLKFGKSLNIGYGKYCSLTCTNKNSEHKEKIKITNNIVYGGNTPFSSKDVISKTKKTNIERYGVDNVMKLDRVKEIFKQGSLNKYGTEFPAQSKNTKIRIENKLKYEKIEIINSCNGLYSIKCQKCNEITIFNNNEINYRFRIDIPICKNCFNLKNNISYPETEISDYIKSFNINVIENDRKKLNGLELDLLIPEYNLAIEFNGLYWHSEIYKDKNYHLNKTQQCEAKKIKLIHIFEDEWLFKKDIVKSRLINILGLTPNKIYARKTIIKEISPKESKEFLDFNHIQGNVNAKIKLGLYYDNELVSIMTFGKGRIIMGGNSNQYELLRFCNKLNTTVIGGADKLLKYFIKTYQPKEIISYADRRWSQGDLYEKLGFNFIHNSKPNYFYINQNIREYRFKYRKNILVKEGYDINKTERDIMLERKIYRIYDCGAKLYKLNL